MKFAPLQSRKVKEVKKLLKETYGFEEELNYAFFGNEKKIYIVSKDIIKIDFEKVRINSIGLYFGEVNDRSQLRLSIEAAQLIGPKSTKNILDLNEEEAKQWMKGEEIPTDSEIDDFVLIRNSTDFLGCAKPKGGKLLNFVPKARRVSMD